jgi:hypothetical protein
MARALSDVREALVLDEPRPFEDTIRKKVLTDIAPAKRSAWPAVEDIFARRAAEAEATGAPSRSWPARLTVHPHWGPSFAQAADSAGLTIGLADAVMQVNAWLDLIEHA